MNHEKTEKALTEIRTASFALLEETGVHVGSEKALSLLEAARVRVDWGTGRAHPKEADFIRALSHAPSSFSVYGRKDHDPLVLAIGNTYFLSGGASLEVWGLNGKLEPATWDHLRQFNALLDALENVHMCINQVDPQGSTGSGMYIRLAAEMMCGIPKPLCLQASRPEDIAAFIEMGTAIRGSADLLRRKPVFMVGLNAEPPLSVSEEIADAFLAVCTAGIPASLGNFNMLGMTAPVTVAGAVAQLDAMQITAIILAQAAPRGCPVFYTAFSGSANLRTLEPVSADFRAMQEQRLAVRLGARSGLPVYGFGGTDAWQEDAQASAEHAAQWQVMLDEGCTLVQGPTSMMDRMMISGFAQAVIDNDILTMLIAANEVPVVSSDTLAAEVITEVVRDAGFADMKFAAHPHTAAGAHGFAAAYRAFSTGGRHGASVTARAGEAARQIVRSHVPEPLPPATERRVREIEKKYLEAGDPRS